MKTILKNNVWMAALLLVIVTTLSSCAFIRKTKAPTLSQGMSDLGKIRSYRPLHLGPPIRGRLDEYSYNMHRFSIQIVRIQEKPFGDFHADSLAEIFDVNMDGTYDSVWIYQNSRLEFATTIQGFGPEQTATQADLMKSILLANTIKEKVGPWEFTENGVRSLQHFASE